jgi:hypothetical protein
VTRAETTAAAVTVAALAAAALWSLHSGAPAGLRTTIQLHGGNAACPRHGLYRRFDGHAARQALVQPGGWAWFADPPAAEVI